MALDKHIIEIPLGAGLSENVDKRIVQMPFLLKADNVEFSTQGQIKKRRGYESLNGTNLPADTTGVNAVFEHAGVPHLYSRTGVWAYDTTAGAWFSADSRGASPIALAVRREQASQHKAVNYDVACGDGRVVEVWEADSKVWYQISDEQSGVVITHATVVPDVASCPKIIHFNGTFLAFGQASGALYAATMAATAEAFGAPSTFVTSGVGVYDVTAQSTSATVGYVAYAGTAGTAIVVEIDKAATVATAVFITHRCELGIAVHVYSTSAILVSGLHSSSDTLYLTHGRYAATTLAEAYSQSNVNSIAAYDETPTSAIAGTISGAQYLHRVTMHKTSGTSVLVAYSGQYITSAGFGYGSGGYPIAGGDIFAAARWCVVTFASGVTTGAVHTLPHMIVSGKAFKPSDLEPCVPFEYYLHHRTASSTVDLTLGIKQTATVLCMVDLDTFTVDNKGEETSTVAHLPIILARYNGDVAGQRNSTAAHLGHGVLVDGLWHHPCPVVTTVRPTSAGASRFTDGSYSEEIFAAVPLVELTTLRLTSFDFDPGPARILRHNNAEAINQGGYLAFFDGGTFGENTLLFDPARFAWLGTPGVSLVTTAATASPGSFKTGTTIVHEISLYLQLKDAQGNLHRSGLMTGGDEYDTDTGVVGNARLQSIDVRFAWPGLTWWRGRGGVAPTAVLCVGEKNVDPGGNLYVVAELPISTFTTAVLGLYKVSTTELRQVDNDRVTVFPPVYTAGGILPSESPPPFRDIAGGTSRMYGISAERPSEVWGAKLPSLGVAPEWNAQLTVPSNPANDYVACASMDEKVLLFTRDRVFVIGAGGPDNSGDGGFDAPELLSSDTGCVNKRSVIEGPFGIIFQGARGFYQVDRGMGLTYIGGPVEVSLLDTQAGEFPSTTALPIYSATIVPFYQQVRWTTKDQDVMVVYDYARQTWRTQPHNSFHGAMIGDRYVVTKNTGSGYAVARERTTAATSYADVLTYTSGGTISNAMDIETAWIKVAGLQGFQRVWKVLVLGEYRAMRGSSNPGLLTFLFYKDYDEDTAVQTEIVSFTTSVAAAAGDPFQIELRLNASMQKCMAMKLRITETPSRNLEAFSFPEEGVRLSSIALECGVKKTVKRFPTVRT